MSARTINTRACGKWFARAENISMGTATTLATAVD